MATFELEKNMNDRRQFLATNFKLAAGGVIFSAIEMALLRSVWAQQAAPIGSGTRLVLLGTTGGPPPKGQRSYAANALIVKGEPYVIDCGNGIVRQLVLANINLLKVNRIFITHHHDDHNADLGTLMGLAWTNGRNDPIDAYGPPGTEAMMRAFLDYFRPNAEIRMLDERRLVPPEKVFRSHDVTTPGVVFQDENVKVTAAENTHFPKSNTELSAHHRSWAYRFDAADRSIVFSGDTAYSDNVIALAKGADVLVHEAMHLEITRDLTRKLFIAQGRPPQEVESALKHVLETHASTEMVGQVAAAAGVKTVVLTHLIPYREPEVVSDDMFKEGVRKYFSGEIVVGKDLMSI